MAANDGDTPRVWTRSGEQLIQPEGRVVFSKLIRREHVSVTGSRVRMSIAGWLKNV